MGKYKKKELLCWTSVIELQGVEKAIVIIAYNKKNFWRDIIRMGKISFTKTFTELQIQQVKVEFHTAIRTDIDGLQYILKNISSTKSLSD